MLGYEFLFGKKPELYFETIRPMVPFPNVIGSLADLIIGDDRIGMALGRGTLAHSPVPSAPTRAESMTASLPTSLPE